MTPLRAFRRRLAVALVLTTSGMTPAVAQRTGGSARARWTDHYAPEIGQATAAERAFAMTTLDEIQRILEQVLELAQPRGFEVGRQIHGGTLAFGERGVLSYNLRLWFYMRSKAAALGEGNTCIEIDVNKSRGALADENGKAFFLEQAIGEPVPGATISYEGLRWDMPSADRRSGYVMLTSRGVLPWNPISREEFLRAQIFLLEGRSGEKEQKFRKSLEKTSYERYMDEAVERKKTRDESVAAMARAQGRAVAEELRKTLEQSDRQVAEQLKAAEAEERKQSGSAITNSPGDALRAQLAAMTAAERASPATAKNGAHELVAADDPEGHRVLTPDLEFWRARRSRAEVHSITVAFHPGSGCAYAPVRAALEKAFQSLDWAALKRIVDRPW